ncbi:Alpha/Beta hydrolase protein [Mycena galopus ATCC 62051]|nr:Alpha/Beta hydrolase protein [Mycena galopus ATCC 62051]
MTIDSTNTTGYVVRDDTKKELVVAWRGSSIVYHKNLQESGTVIALVQSQLEQYPNYTVVHTGHSLGGSLANLASVSLKSNFPTPCAYTCTTNPARPTKDMRINTLYGDQSFFYVRTTDGILTAFPMLLCYRHNGVEFWQTSDPTVAATLEHCKQPTAAKNIIYSLGCNLCLFPTFLVNRVCSELSDGFTPTHLKYASLVAYMRIHPSISASTLTPLSAI